MTFEYEARDPLGHTVQGMVEAGSVEEARQQLNRDGLSVLSIEQADEVGTLLARRVTKILRSASTLIPTARERQGKGPPRPTTDRARRDLVRWRRP